MKFDDLVYNILEQKKDGLGKTVLAGAGLVGGALLANKFPTQTAAAVKGAGNMYQQHVAPHVNKLMGGGKQAHAASSPNHPTETQFKEPGPSHAPKTHHPTEPQHQEPGPSHAPPHDIDIPDHGV